MNKKLPYDSEAALKQFGANLAVARKRRGWRQEDVKERTGLTRLTIRKIEAGEPSVAMGNYMLVLSILGGADQIRSLMNPAEDLLGGSLTNSLPDRVRKVKNVDNDF
ncbi:helix-turn-helix domain-containing protein [uncultured Amphritea sp.]|uniref:helix-turn-helix domain-containing protein n=1 Tax=uncultured Amphritea sp. TaxID=981605 RepID=UPI00262A6BC2|nr:helix-turn-helix domain-containing protein [uncultured Amphritea sp.]